MQEELHISIIQTDLHWEDREQNIEHLTNSLAKLSGKTDIIVLPETFTTGFSMNPGIAESGNETLEWMKKMAAEKNAALAGSFFVNDHGKCYNRLHFVEPNGKTTIYNKKHLFRLTNEQDIFSAGEQQMIVEYKGWKISLLVCYDLRFPVWMRRSEKNDYDLLLLVANWPERRSFAWNHLLIARAIENQSYVVASNRVGTDGTGTLYAGESCIIDPMGQYAGKGAPFYVEVIESTVRYSKLTSIRKALPFFEDRDVFNL
jgi:omega-amidase